MKKIGLYLSVLALVGAPFFVSASPILRSGDTVSVDNTQILENDFYGFSPDITISGPANNDAYLAGGTVVVNATIKGDLTVLGGSVQVHGDIGDDVRIFGGEVVIANAVKGDVVVAGGSLVILSTARVDGDVIFQGEELTVEGAVKGNVHGMADTARINTKVDGNVTLNAPSGLTLGEKTEIGGMVSYESFSELIRAQNAVVVGEIVREQSASASFKEVLQVYLIILSIIGFASLSLFMVARNRIQRLCDEVSENPGSAGLIGLGIFVMTPILGIVLLISVIGSLVGIVIFAMYICVLLSAGALMCIMVGHYIQKIVFKATTITVRTVGFGLVGLGIMVALPVIGGFLVFAAIMITLGGIGTTVYKSLRV